VKRAEEKNDKAFVPKYHQPIEFTHPARSRAINPNGGKTMKRLGVFGCLSLAVLFTGGPANAQTPDGETPANDGICDELQGGTPGLYGLCVAFCEAQDIADVFDPLTDEELYAIENGVPSGRILETYNMKNEDGDVDMPCIKVEQPCPCFTADEVASIDGVSPSGSTIAFQCSDNGTGDPRFNVIREDRNPAGRQQASAFIDTNPNSDEFNRGFCSYINRQVSPTISRMGDTGFFTGTPTITPVQAVQCKAIVDAACDAAGE
jgi:hypothetical protein